MNSMIAKLRSSSRQKPAPLIASDQLAKDHGNGQKASKMNSVIAKRRSSSRQKPAPIIASDQLAKDHGNGQKASKISTMIAKRRRSSRQKPAPIIASDQLADDHGNGQKASEDAHESKSIQAEEQGTKDLCVHEGGNRAHVLVVHFGESIWEEKDFTEESSFLDVLSICKKFIDIYSVDIVITDWHGKPLRNDEDLLCLLKEQEHLENISIYVDVYETAQPPTFKLPQDNPAFACIPNISQVRDVTTEDDLSSETESDNIGKNIEDSVSEKNKNNKIMALKSGEKLEKVRKCRGRNKNKKILALKDGEKLEIQFYNYRGVGPNHKCWSRHLGKIVRDRHICPVRVRTWKEMPDVNKQHMWDWVKGDFFNPDMELYREHTLEHMGALWMAWRSSLNVKYMKPCETKELALKNVPPGMDVTDWEWLVTEKFSSDEFQEISARNSNNRVNGVMHHRTGSQPHRHIIYEMGGKVDTPADVAKIFYATRQKNGKLDTRDQEKYDEIVKTVEANAALSPIEVVETCFGPQTNSKVFGFGGGIKRKHFSDRKRKKRKHSSDTKAAYITDTDASAHITEPESAYITEPESAYTTEPESAYTSESKAAHTTESKAAYIAELEAKLHEKDEEHKNLIKRVEEIERRLSQMENGNQPTSNVPSTCGDQP